MQVKNRYIILFSFICLSVRLTACEKSERPELNSLVNFSHLDRLYEEITIDDQKMGIIHIYSDYPAYDWIDAPGEGTACIDDVARGAILYLRHYHYTHDTSSLNKAKDLLNFILYMQAPNGLFYNFVYRDLTINKTRENSQPRANWWTWRALWAMGEGLQYLPGQDSVFCNKLSAAMVRAFPAIDSLLQYYPKTEGDQPTWLPFQTAADQAAVLQLALMAYYRHSPDQKIREYIAKVAEGIMLMQRGNETGFPYGAILSWNNTWHAWGNCQAYTLLVTGSFLEQTKWIEAGLREVRSFHPYLIKRNQLSEFTVEWEEDTLTVGDEKQYSQIAYGIRPQVWANLKAYEINRDETYARQAAEIAGWLFGKNTARELIYDPQNGRCFDGLDEQKINKNSGAESTLEALLTLLEIERIPEARKIVNDYYVESGKGN